MIMVVLCKKTMQSGYISIVFDAVFIFSSVLHNFCLLAFFSFYFFTFFYFFAFSFGCIFLDCVVVKQYLLSLYR